MQCFDEVDNVKTAMFERLKVNGSSTRIGVKITQLILSHLHEMTRLDTNDSRHEYYDSSPNMADLLIRKLLASKQFSILESSIS